MGMDRKTVVKMSSESLNAKLPYSYAEIKDKMVKPFEPYEDLNNKKMANAAKKAFEAQKMADGIPRFSDQNMTEKLMHTTFIRDNFQLGRNNDGFIKYAFKRPELMPLAYAIVFGLTLCGVAMGRGLLYNPDVNVNRDRRALGEYEFEKTENKVGYEAKLGEQYKSNSPFRKFASLSEPQIFYKLNQYMDSLAGKKQT